MGHESLSIVCMGKLWTCRVERLLNLKTFFRFTVHFIVTIALEDNYHLLAGAWFHKCIGGSVDAKTKEAKEVIADLLEMCNSSAD
jgi:hypothetical protein